MTVLLTMKEFGKILILDVFYAWKNRSTKWLSSLERDRSVVSVLGFTNIGHRGNVPISGDLQNRPGGLEYQFGLVN